jgi:hypothetical protein
MPLTKRLDRDGGLPGWGNRGVFDMPAEEHDPLWENMDLLDHHSKRHRRDLGILRECRFRPPSRSEVWRVPKNGSRSRPPDEPR